LRDQSDQKRNEIASALRIAAAESGAASVLILHFPTIAARLSREPGVRETAGSVLKAWDPSPGADEGLAAISVSPWSISSVERVARYLQWHLYTPLLERYPPTITAHKQIQLQLPKWLSPQANGSTWMMIQTPGPKEKSIPELVKDYESRLMQELATRGGRAAQKAKTDASDAADALRSQLDAARSLLESICVCPVCKDSGASISRHDTRTRSFVVSCRGCQASWGVHACGGERSPAQSCGTAVPFLQLEGFGDWIRAHPTYSARSCSQMFGADLLAVPSRDASGKPAWRCGKCGAV
jgi:hypothetical protein